MEHSTLTFIVSGRVTNSLASHWCCQLSCTLLDSEGQRSSCELNVSAKCAGQKLDLCLHSLFPWLWLFDKVEVLAFN